MAWKKLITEDDFGGFGDPSGTIGGAAVSGAATTAMRSAAAPALDPLPSREPEPPRHTTS